MTNKIIALDRLELAACNVRQSVDEATIAELAESIAAHGVLQTLTVRPAGKGRFEVIIGGRRLRALRRLAADGRLDAKAPVACAVRDVDEPTARELGLTENVMRVALNPVDEFEAYAALAAAEVPAEDIARRFGVDVRHVKRRMKLGQLAEPIREALRADELTLDAATAFTVGTTEQQLNAWTELTRSTSTRYLGEWNVRGLLNRQLVHAGDRLVRFVGEDAYLAAGGGITEDLFRDHRYIQDPALLRRLAMDKLDAIAEEYRREGWRWAETSLDRSCATTIVGGEEPVEAFLSAEEAEQRAAIEARIEALENGADDTDDANEELHRLHAQLDALTRRYSPEGMARSGVLIGIDLDGRLFVERGLVRREDVLEATPAEHAGDDGSEPDHPAAAADDDEAIGAAEDPKSEGPEPAWRMPQLLQADVAAWRTQVLQLAITRQPDVAYDLLVFRLVTSVADARRCRHYASALDLHARATRPESSLKDGTEAKQALADHEQTLSWSWVNEDDSHASLFGRFCALPRGEKDRLMAWAVALTLRPQIGGRVAENRDFEDAGAAAQTDIPGTGRRRRSTTGAGRPGHTCSTCWAR